MKIPSDLRERCREMLLRRKATLLAQPKRTRKENRELRRLEAIDAEDKRLQQQREEALAKVRELHLLKPTPDTAALLAETLERLT